MIDVAVLTQLIRQQRAWLAAQLLFGVTACAALVSVLLGAPRWCVLLAPPAYVLSEYACRRGTGISRTALAMLREARRAR